MAWIMLGPKDADKEQEARDYLERRGGGILHRHGKDTTCETNKAWGKCETLIPEPDPTKCPNVTVDRLSDELMRMRCLCGFTTGWGVEPDVMDQMTGHQVEGVASMLGINLNDGDKEQAVAVGKRLFSKFKAQLGLTGRNGPGQ